jgi:hypothetical protein
MAAGIILLCCQTPVNAQLTILRSFGDGSIPNDGAHPSAGLIQGPNGDFFGDTIFQANTLTTNAGTVFRMTAAGNVKIIKRFGLTSNIWPIAPLLYYKKKLIGIGGGAVFALNLQRVAGNSVFGTNSPVAVMTEVILRAVSLLVRMAIFME